MTIMFGFTGLALGIGGSFFLAEGAAATAANIAIIAGTWLAAAADAAIVGMSAYSAYSSAQQQKANAKAEAEIQRRQAEAYSMQSADLQRQAAIEQDKAGIAQIQAEQEAERRSRILANDIGSAYANYAGNGLLVEGDPGDTFGNVLKTTVGEAQSDIATIRDNGRMSVWDHQSNARSLLVSSRTSGISAMTSLIGAATSRKNAKHYNQASYLGAATGGISSAASAVSSGFAGASYAKKTA